MARPRYRKLLLALTATAVSVAAAEVTLRILDLPAVETSFHVQDGGAATQDVMAWPATVPDRELFWRFAPGGDGVMDSVNALGLRGWAPARAKTARDLRIVCVGDSCTYGLGVRFEAAYGPRLERLLQERLPHRSVESFLVALPGYTTHQSRALWQRTAGALRADVTVLYCGVWNDYQPAVGLTDAERARRLSPALRSFELVRRWLRPPPSLDVPPDPGEPDGELPRAPRVSEHEFVAHLEHMVGAARAGGSLVVLVVPPLPERTLLQHPLGRSYQDAVRRVARDLDVLTVDGPELVEPAATTFFVDGVHPSPHGHDRIARAALELVMPHCSDGSPPVDAPRPRIDSVSPAHVDALSSPWLTLRGHGLAATIDRVWIGPRWIRDVEIVSDTELRAHLLNPPPPGRHGIELITAHGGEHSTVELTVAPPRPPELSAELRRTGAGDIELVLRCPVPPHCVVTAWAAAERSAVPQPTPCGPFYLHDPTQEPPYNYADMGLHTIRAVCRSKSGWTHRSTLRPEHLLAPTDTVYVQALITSVYDPWVAFGSTVAAVAIPP